MLGYEKRKVAIDMYKHITIISVGVIAIIASFLKRLIELEKAKNFILVSVISFFCAIIFSLIICFILLAKIEEVPHKAAKVLRYFAIFTFAGFLIGIGSLAFLIIKNLH